MSWLSTFFDNNKNVLGGIASGLAGGGLPGAVLGGLTSTMTPRATAAAGLPATGVTLYQGQGRPPVLVDSASRKIGIPLPGGGVIGAEETKVRRYGAQEPTRVNQQTGLVCYPGFHIAGPRTLSAGLCIKNRKMNFANGRAAMRAARRLKGTHKLLLKIEKALHRGVRIKSRGPRRTSCGCKG